MSFYWYARFLMSQMTNLEFYLCRSFRNSFQRFSLFLAVFSFLPFRPFLHRLLPVCLFSGFDSLLLLFLFVLRLVARPFLFHRLNRGFVQYSDRTSFIASFSSLSPNALPGSLKSEMLNSNSVRRVCLISFCFALLAEFFRCSSLPISLISFPSICFFPCL